MKVRYTLTALAEIDEIISYIAHDNPKAAADVAAAILAHSKPGIRGVNDRYEYLEEKRDALELWAHQLETIASSKLKAVAVRAVPLAQSQTGPPRATFAERLGRSRRA